MNELILKQAEEELVAALHTDGAELTLPLPFERDIFLLGTDVVGTNYVKNIAALYETLQEGERVRLVREPENPYDEYAIRRAARGGRDLPGSAGPGEQAGLHSPGPKQDFCAAHGRGQGSLRHRSPQGDRRRVLSDRDQGLPARLSDCTSPYTGAANGKSYSRRLLCYMRSLFICASA